MSKPNSTPLTAERLREVLHYAPKTGIFTWIVPPCTRVKAGGVAGTSLNGYRRNQVDGELFYAHRLAWFYMYGVWPVNDIDHINGNKSDNRIKNLREATRSENSQNQKDLARKNISGFLGVDWHKQRCAFRARIKLNGKSKYLGYFSTAELAHAAYVDAKRQIHPFSTI